jgi:hypothetical protein
MVIVKFIPHDLIYTNNSAFFAAGFLLGIILIGYFRNKIGLTKH